MNSTARSLHGKLPSSRTAHGRKLSSTASAKKAVPFSLRPVADEVKQPQHKFLRMIMFGKPGAGKGTLSSRLTERYNITSLATGDLLRQEIIKKTDVGIMADEIMADGGLVPDDVMMKVITGKLEDMRNKHWLLDGFPRNVAQGELLDSHLRRLGAPLSLIVNLEVPDDIILSRIADRWIHLPSGRVYNMGFNRPKRDGKDDVTGEPLSKRPDDNPDVFSRRLKKFYDSTSPLISYFSSRSSPSTAKLVTLSGKTSDEIWPKLEAIVKDHFPIRSRGDFSERVRNAHGPTSLDGEDTKRKSPETLLH